MRKALLIALRDYNAAVRTKGFIIGLVLAPVLMGGGLIMVKITEKRVDTRDRKVAVVDRSGAIVEALAEAAKQRNETETRDSKTGKKVRPEYHLEIIAPDEEDPAGQRLELSERVRKGDLYGFLEVGKEAVKGSEGSEAARITYRSENPVFDEARRWIQQPVNDRVRGLRMAKEGLDAEVVARVTRWVNVEGLGLVSRDEETGEIKEAVRKSEMQAIFLPYGMMMLMFVLVVAAANPLIHSTLEEKMQRIAEVLLGSVRPSQLMMGKLLGAIGVSVTMVSVYIVGGLVAAHYADMSDAIPYRALPWFALYGMSALLMYGAMFLAVGSACSDLKDAQSLMMPLWLVVMLPMFLWLPVIKEPASSFAMWMSLVPWFTPMLMMVRLGSEVTIPMWQPVAGLVGVALVTLASVWAAGRIFRVGILMQGKPPKLTEVLRWATRG